MTMPKRPDMIDSLTSCRRESRILEVPVADLEMVRELAAAQGWRNDAESCLRSDDDARNAAVRLLWVSRTLPDKPPPVKAMAAALKALADKVDATIECDHVRRSCEEIGCIGQHVSAARDVLKEFSDV